VYTVNDDIATQVEVTVGPKIGGNIEIIRGLENGDRVIKDANNNIYDGMNVKVN
jgi:multidrug efflux pump subunit AcrA (membrane-fusion protein)